MWCSSSFTLRDSFWRESHVRFVLLFSSLLSLFYVTQELEIVSSGETHVMIRYLNVKMDRLPVSLHNIPVYENHTVAWNCVNQLRIIYPSRRFSTPRMQLLKIVLSENYFYEHMKFLLYILNS